ncbi:MAG: carbamoyltransferase HypF [Cyclobacteriaceae bacterium]|nr:carbamoyltransferase HypF [Cyclobacteriaceae bacterium]
MKTWHLHIRGMVQGVGFRPYVYRFARKNSLNGYILNGTDGVHIEFNCRNYKEAKEITSLLLEKIPPFSIVTSFDIKEAPHKLYKEFTIHQSNEEGPANLIITPDLALCDECREELNSSDNPRFQYGFITCTSCGPRYSIMAGVPYDRERTSMRDFEMCNSCKVEYNTATDRRYFSQTQSCPDCGIKMQLTDLNKKSKPLDDQQKIPEETAKLLKSGKIVAVKGIGGYLLLCDAQNPKVVKELRKRKNRPAKPFAVMFPDIESITNDTLIKRREREELLSKSAPIVLVRHNQRNKLAINEIAPGLNNIGVMLPYTPLFQLIIDKFGSPLIATSANISNSPLIYQEEEAFKMLTGIADYIVTNNREIYIPQDDSVVVYSSLLGDKHILRRSRGLAPSFPYLENNDIESGKLAMGADMKSTFALSHHNTIYVSQYLGDMGSFDTELNYNKVLDSFTSLVQFEANEILIDMHPGYYSSMLGERKALEKDLPLLKVQHHEAHFMAVLAENNLIHTETPLMGVVWDGTGLGYDSSIWGGEFFTYDDFDLEHIDQFPQFSHILQDKFSKEPLLPALSLLYTFCNDLKINENALLKSLTKREIGFYSNLLKSRHNLKTSSMGRVFDGIAAILGFKGDNTYEGEAALYLQSLAENYALKHGAVTSRLTNSIAGFPDFLEQLISYSNNHNLYQQLSYEFHLWLVGYIKKMAMLYGHTRIAFSGGVFQNSLLTDLLKIVLKPQFELFFHKNLSPNDESVSYGQLIYSHIGDMKKGLFENLNSSGKHFDILKT